MILEKTWTHHRSITDYTLSKQEFNRRDSIKQTFNIIDSNKNEKRATNPLLDSTASLILETNALKSNQWIKIFPTKQKLERHCSIPRDTRPFSPISIYVHRGLKQPNVSIPFTHATTLISYVHALHGDSIRYLVNSSHVLPTYI